MRNEDDNTIFTGRYKFDTDRDTDTALRLATNVAENTFEFCAQIVEMSHGKSLALIAQDIRDTPINYGAGCACSEAEAEFNSRKPS